MRMANKTNVNANKEAETVEEVKAVDDAPVTEGTDVKVNEEETVPADKKEEVEAAKPKPVSKGNRRGSKALQLELEKAKEQPETKKSISVCWQSLRICASVTRRNPRRCMISEPRKC